MKYQFKNKSEHSFTYIWWWKSLDHLTKKKGLDLANGSYIFQSMRLSETNLNIVLRKYDDEEV